MAPSPAHLREVEELQRRIRAMAAERRAVILAHNYERPEVQDVAHYVGDSLGLSREAARTDAEVIVFCGVHFMAETAAILSPQKTVLLPDLAAWSRKGLMACLLQYEGYGWTGIVPPACHNTLVMVPVNFAPWLWGWPNRFIERMRNAGSSVILIGPYSAGDPGTAGIDTPEEAALVPPKFPGLVWTNDIATIGPIVRAKN